MMAEEGETRPDFDEFERYDDKTFLCKWSINNFDV